MKFKNKIIVVCLCASVFAGGCGQDGQNTTKSKNSEGTAQFEGKYRTDSLRIMRHQKTFLQWIPI